VADPLYGSLEDDGREAAAALSDTVAHLVHACGGLLDYLLQLQRRCVARQDLFRQQLSGSGRVIRELVIAPEQKGRAKDMVSCLDRVRRRFLLYSSSGSDSSACQECLHCLRLIRGGLLSCMNCCSAAVTSSPASNAE
jgi:hypothetical protein